MTLPTMIIKVHPAPDAVHDYAQEPTPQILNAELRIVRFIPVLLKA